MKEYKEGKQKSATTVHKRRLSLPTIYEGPLSTSPLHSIARPSPPSLVCPPLTGFLSHPCTCSISALLNHQDPRNELLFSADRSAHRTLFPAREKGSRGPEGGPRFEQFLLALTLCPPKGGGKKEKEKKKKTGGNCVPLAKSHCILMETHSKMFRP